MNLTKAEIDNLVATMSPEEIKNWVQQQAYGAWMRADCRGTFEGATGVGKTRVGVMAAWQELKSNPDALVYISVPTETLRDVDWPDEFRKWGHEDLLDKVKILCHTSMEKEKPECDVDLFIFDEVHHVTVLNTMFFGRDWKVFKVLGLTATLPDKDANENDRDKRILIDGLCPSVFKVTVEEAIALKLVSDFEVVVLKFDLDDTQHVILSGTKKAPCKRTEKGHYDYLTKNLSKCMYMKSKEGLKFVWIQKRMAFLYNLPSKLQLAKQVMQHVLTEKDGTPLRTLIFCGSIEQSRELCGENVYNSKTDSGKLDAFQAKEIDYLGVVDALNEGKNIDDLDQSIIIQLSSKELKLIQRIGRNIRFREGHVGKIIVLVAKGTADEKWYKTAFANFDRSRIKEHYVTTKQTV